MLVVTRREMWGRCAAAVPKTFDLETLGGTKTKPRRYIGIYRQEGDVRQFCFVIAGLPRPDAFTAPRGSGRILVTLERAGERTHRHQGAGPIREGRLNPPSRQPER